MKRSLESKIRLNVVLLYIVIALVCVGFVFFFFSLAGQLAAKKTTYEEYYRELSIVNEMTDAINRTQIEANLYIYTRDNIHLENFKKQTADIECKIDSLRNNHEHLPADSIWNEINQLLEIKGILITELNEQLTIQNEVIRLKDRNLKKSVDNESKSLLDTIVQGGDKKKFWERVSNVFNPVEKEDTIIIVTQQKTNIIKERESDTKRLNDAIKTTETIYTKRIEAIEEQIRRLVFADQEISSKVSGLLIQLNTQTIHSRWQELEKEEAQLRQNNRKALILGIVALVFLSIFLILIITDVNKGQVLRKALEKANKKIRQVMESRHKLLLSVSHDIKTPLNSILGYLELLQQKNNLTEKEIGSMHNSGKHILALLSNLLEYSSMEQGKLQLAHTDFSLDELCDELSEMFAPLAKAKKLSFICEKDFDSELILHSDPLRIKQILTNLLSNAIKYTQEGSVSFKTSYNKKGIIAFTVNDTGVGIPEDKLSSIYKPFTRIDANNSLAEGSGFGMYVAKGLISIFHGKIHYQSKEGEGTAVSVSLPAEKSKMKQQDLTLKHILLIDDDDVFVSVVSRMCTQLGHRVTACKAWSEFEEKLPEIANFDMILTDMEMTMFTGQDILAKVREFNVQIPVCLMTGRIDYHSQLAQSEGFADYLGKPVTQKSLCSLIGGVLPDIAEDENIESLLGEKNDEFVVEVIEEFLFSAINHIVELRETVEQDNFVKAQNICHKMRPMCIQLNADEELISIMKELDSFRNQAVPETYQWKEKIVFLTDGLEQFLIQIQEKYLNEED